MTLHDGIQVPWLDNAPYFSILPYERAEYFALPTGLLSIHLLHVTELDHHVLTKLFPHADAQLAYYVRLEFGLKTVVTRPVYDIMRYLNQFVIDTLKHIQVPSIVPEVRHCRFALLNKQLPEFLV